jgi:hypothetical protein
MGTGISRIAAAALIALTLTGCVTQREPRGAPPLNATALENERQGSVEWEITSPALAREIEGYASRTSINRGDAIDLFVSTLDPSYTIDVFRMGWYGGAGARQVAGPISRPGMRQPTPPPDSRTGLIECRWHDPYRLATRDRSAPWPSGVYLARLTASPSGRQAYIVFVVRDDARPSDLVFQSSVTTFAAYNNWGGKSLYAFNSAGGPAHKVSFDRPYAMAPYGIRLDGAGDFLRRWEYNALRWLEREGYDVTYITDVDTHERGDALLRHRVFLSIGHDEYWSWDMRDHVEAARDRGINLVFLGANASFWQIRFEPGPDGAPNRTIVGYKDAAAHEDPLAIDSDPANDHLVTGRWRNPPVSRPEASMIGVMYVADPVDADIVVADASHWAFAGTSLANGDTMPGLLGYEVDAAPADARSDLARLARSPFIVGDHTRTLHADMTIYTAGSGALVFATGSMQWNWGLDGYNAPWLHPLRVNAAAQQVTRNVLRRMLTRVNRDHGDDRYDRPKLR